MTPVQRWDGHRTPPRRSVPIFQQLREILFDTPGLARDELVVALRNQGIETDPGQVLTVLCGQVHTFIGAYSRTAPWHLTVGARQRVEQLRESTTRRPASPATKMPAPTPPRVPAAAASGARTPAQPVRGNAPLVEAIQATLRQEPGIAASDIASQLRRKGFHVDRRVVNSELYRHLRRLFLKDESERPLWRNTETPVAPPPPRQAPQPAMPPAPRTVQQARPPVHATRRDLPAPPLPPSITLYAWQRQALDAWEAEGHRGIVEAVTGTGKTRVGMVAIHDSLAAGGFVHVLVPTIDLQEQWCREIETLFPGVQVGRRGNDRTDTFPRFQLIVSVVNSARDYVVGALPPNSLLVADECHRYGADGNARALRDAFPRRLGLTATFARDDGGCEAFLAPYFGETCFQMGYAQAIEDEVTAHFKVALVGVNFGLEAERQAYDEAAELGKQARGWLIAKKWAPPEPFGDFIKHVANLADDSPIQQGSDNRFTAVGKAREYMKSFSTRRTLLASTTSKQDALVDMLDAVRAASRTIVFTESIDTASEAATLLHRHGIRSSAIHSKMAKADRKAILARFARGEISAIAAPKVLDEGIDVPAADLAIIFATSKTRRQMVQRMGRVLRRKADGRLARFVVLYVEDTTEDPNSGAHESFIGEIADPSVAEEVRSFDTSSSWEDIVDFLNSHTVPGGQPSARMA